MASVFVPTAKLSLNKLEKNMKKILLKNKLFSAFFSLLFFLFGFSFSAKADGLVPCGTGTTDPCTLCHLIVGIQGLISWGMGILVIAAITAITISGIIYIISSGNSSLTKQAKDFVTSAVIGFAIMLGAWLIVNTTLNLLPTKTDLGIQKESWYKFSCSTTSSTITSTTGSDVPIVETSVDDTSLTFSGATKQQYKDVSPDLQLLLNCFAEKMGGGDKFTITSISDNNGGGATCYTNNPSWGQCTSPDGVNCCHYAKNSCHYGGTGPCAGKSYAIDVKEVSSVIDGAAQACNAKHQVKGNITYISIPGGCGCE